MQINNKRELLDFIELSKNQNSNTSETLQIIREKSKELLLSKGDILPNTFIETFEIFQDTQLAQDETINKHINSLENYYKSATPEEKFVINNLLFGLEILNANAKEGLKKFIGRIFDFSLMQYKDNRNLQFDRNFILRVKAEDILFMEVVKEIIDPNTFLKKDALAKRANFVNMIAVLWNNPVMFGNKIWLSVIDDFVNLLQKCREANLMQEYMYIHFFIYHVYTNNIQTMAQWRNFNTLIEKPASEFYKTYSQTHQLSQPKKSISSKKKKRVGFIIDRFAMSSPYRVMYSLWKNLMRDENFKKNYKVYIYSLNYVDKQSDNFTLINQLLELGIKVYSPEDKFADYGLYYPHLEKAIDIREKIIKNKIDYLITMASGYDINNFILSNRTAPQQIFWSHGNCAFDIENIDKRISHFDQECKEFDWKLFDVPMSDDFLIGTAGEKKEALILKENIKKYYGEDTIFLGTIGRLVKLESEEYIQVLSEIMKQNPNTIYLACGVGNDENVKALMQKYGIDLGRVQLPGQVKPHIFGWIIDIWLDTFPVHQGNSREEYYSKNAGVATNFERVNPFEEKTEKDRILKEFKNREEIFQKIFGFDINQLKQDVKYDALILGVYKKNTKKIQKCIDKIYQNDNRKEQWLEHINCLIQNKTYFEMYKWITYKIWCSAEENKKIDFEKILKGK